MTAELYVVDTNIVITLFERQARDVYPSLWQQWEDLISGGRLIMPKVCWDELKEPTQQAWAKGFPDFIQDITDEGMATVIEITNQFRGWVQMAKNAADPFVIAQAKHLGATIITDERWKGTPGKREPIADKNQRIPNVAAAQDIDCMTFLEFQRRLGWRF